MVFYALLFKVNSILRMFFYANLCIILLAFCYNDTYINIYNM